jgi:hypothetical protein
VRGVDARDHVRMTSTDIDRPLTAAPPTLRFRWVLTHEGLRMRWDSVVSEGVAESLRLQTEDTALAA